MRVLVTGASSLLGQHTVDRLIAAGHHVNTLQRGSDPSTETTAFAGSITNASEVAGAMSGCEGVIHLAARVGIVGSWDDFHETNVVGTEVVVQTALAAGVQRFVYVSSPSVAHGGEALIGAGADDADPGSTRGHYSTTKALAEAYALSQASEQMAVCALRPHLIWGPGDTQLVGRILDRARSGRLAIVGSGAALIDSTYVTNAADALVAGLEQCEAVSGQTLLISNGEPRTIADLVNGILDAHGISPVSRRVPRKLAFGVGWVAERAWSRFAPESEPPMTTFLAEQLGTAHWFDQQQTRELLQWSPAVSIDEGLRLLAESAS